MHFVYRLRLGFEGNLLESRRAAAINIKRKKSTNRDFSALFLLAVFPNELMAKVTPSLLPISISIGII